MFITIKEHHGDILVETDKGVEITLAGQPTEKSDHDVATIKTVETDKKEKFYPVFYREGNNEFTFKGIGYLTKMVKKTINYFTFIIPTKNMVNVKIYKKECSSRWTWKESCMVYMKCTNYKSGKLNTCYVPIDDTFEKIENNKIKKK